MSSNNGALLMNIVIYMLMAAGIVLMAERTVRQCINFIKMRKRLRRPRERTPYIIEQADCFVAAVTGKEGRGTALIASTIGIFAITFYTTVKYIGGLMPVCFAATLSAVPYLILRFGLEKMRSKGSFEGETFVAEFLSRYRVCRGNLDRSMELMVSDDKGGICRRIMGRVLTKMRETGKDEELRSCADTFYYSLNTNWAGMLAYNIGLAAAEGVDITPALEDILLQLREARTLYEERRRLNSESNKLVVFMVPFSYFVTLFLSVKYLGIDMRQFMHNQFFSAEGIFMFGLMVSMFILNILLLSIMKHRKFDY